MTPDCVVLEGFAADVLVSDSRCSRMAFAFIRFTSYSNPSLDHIQEDRPAGGQPTILSFCSDVKELRETSSLFASAGGTEVRFSSIISDSWRIWLKNQDKGRGVWRVVEGKVERLARVNFGDGVQSTPHHVVIIFLALDRSDKNRAEKKA